MTTRHLQSSPDPDTPEVRRLRLEPADRPHHRHRSPRRPARRNPGRAGQQQHPDRPGHRPRSRRLREEDTMSRPQNAADLARWLIEMEVDDDTPRPSPSSGTTGPGPAATSGPPCEPSKAASRARPRPSRRSPCWSRTSARTLRGDPLGRAGGRIMSPLLFTAHSRRADFEFWARWSTGATTASSARPRRR